MRSDDSYSHEQGPANTGRSDPLAELARLIGQNDPFADLARQGGRPAAQPPTAQSPAAQPPAPSRAAPDWLARTGGRQADPGPAYDDQQSSQGAAYPTHYDDTNHQRDARYEAAPQDSYQGAYAHDGQDNAGYYDENAYYEEGQLPPEETYDEAPPEKKRGGLRTVAALVALAIVGTGGALGYRAWTSPSATGGEPPVIKAEQGPTKVVPAAPSDNQLNKQIYDRVGDRGGEKVVPREEQPVDVRTAATRSMAPGTMGVSGSTGSVLPPLAAPNTAPPSQAATEPKKVKTVAIRPDQPSGAPTTPAARTPVATPPAGATPQPTRVTTVPVQATPARPAATEGGSYMVQVSSQLSESDAQASFRALQQKYPSVLGGQPMAIQRADLGDKVGVRYRVRVGPYSSEQASELCNNLKGAGGQCVVHRN
jgi:SPOR domain